MEIYIFHVTKMLGKNLTTKITIKENIFSLPFVSLKKLKTPIYIIIVSSNANLHTVVNNHADKTSLIWCQKEVAGQRAPDHREN